MFAAVLMILVGVFRTVSGLTAIYRRRVRHAQNYTFSIDDRLGLDPPASRHRRVPRRSESLRPEGAGPGWSRWRSRCRRDRELLFIYYPFWSIVMIALAVWVIWALTRPGVLRY